MPGVYLRHNDEYVEMTEQPFDAESVLQALIAQHPELLTDEDAGQGPLLLVRREAGVSDAEDAGSRWSLDHLYLDASGVPTLVEVKRSSDTRGRREVVAQMLDYAANAKLSFSAERMQAWAAESARASGTTIDKTLAEVLGVEDADAYWAAVETNLDAERFRLVFVSDAIPKELSRIIEFLNGQMTRTDVLAIEVKQYVEGDHQTIVPRVIGNTEQARQTKGPRSGRARIDEAGLVAALSEVGQDATLAGKELLQWAQRRPDVNVRWTKACDIAPASGGGPLLRIWGEGTLEVKVNTLRHADPAWNDDARIEDLVKRLEAIDGVELTGNRRQWPRTPLAPLSRADGRQQLLSVVEELLLAVNRKGAVGGASETAMSDR